MIYTGNMDKSLLAKLNEMMEFEYENLEELLYSAYKMGQQDTIDNMREIYDHDPCMFDDFFHLEETEE